MKSPAIPAEGTPSQNILQDEHQDAQRDPLVMLAGPLAASPDVIGRLPAVPFRTCVWQGGEGLVECVLNHCPDMILLDAAVEDAAGLCRTLSGLVPNIPVILLAAACDADAKKRLLECGCVDCLSLPEQAAEIEPRFNIHLARHLRQRQQQRQLDEMRTQLYSMEEQARVRTFELRRKNYQLRCEIGERLNTETILRAREEQYRTLAENASDIIIRYSTACRRLYVNPAFERIIKLKSSQLIGQSPVDFATTLRNAAEYQAVLERVIATGINADTVVELIDDGGSVSYYQMRVVAEFDRNGKVMSVLAVGRNISHLKEAERYLEESRAQLRDLATHIEAAREEERKHLARELHDELGQLLSTLRMRTRLLQPEYIGDDTKLLRERTEAMLGIIDNAVEMVRRFVTNLRPGILDLDICSALQWLGQGFANTYGVPCRVNVPPGLCKVDDGLSVALFRIAQESLNNVVKHAGATRVSLTLQEAPEWIVLEVQDNGRGFDPVQSARKKTFGILGIKERVEMLKGRLQIDSAVGKGARVRVEIPRDYKKQ
jgi:PAS domain S-box-containing protein